MNAYNDQIQKVMKMQIPNGTILCVKYNEQKQPQIFPGIYGRIMPAYYEVQVELKPSPESHILVEIWLPTESWNGDFLGTGNGGAAGSIATLELVNGLRRGYAVANTDMGTGPDIDSLIGKPERWKDFGYRATHLMTEVGKQVTEQFYGIAPKTSLFFGGSTGGQQALMEAQRFPEDYDGILAIAPANNRTHLHFGFVWNWLALTQTEESAISANTAKEITDYMLEKYAEVGQCLQGDHYFTNPNRIQLPSDVFDDCAALNADQKEAMKKIAKGLTNPVTGVKIYPPLYVPGSEAAEMGLALQSQKEEFAHDFFYLFRWVYGKDFDFKKFDFHSDTAKLDSVLSEYLNATNPDLTAFRDAGGKLLMLHGMADPIIPYTDSLAYYQQVANCMGGTDNIRSFFRYICVPGLGHIAGGPGVQDITAHGFAATPRDREHDALVALSEWIKEDIPPERMLAVAFEDGNILNGIRLEHYVYERPCYAYPGYPVFSGTDPNNPADYKRGVAE